MAETSGGDPVKKSEFVHLHVHSHYSLLNAIPTPKELAAAAAADPQSAMAGTTKTRRLINRGLASFY
jgi:hypothetical protein